MPILIAIHLLKTEGEYAFILNIREREREISRAGDAEKTLSYGITGLQF